MIAVNGPSTCVIRAVCGILLYTMGWTKGSPARVDREIRLAWRPIQYSVALLMVSVPVIFTNLGGPRMEGDEAHYALCGDHILQSGQWLPLSPHPPRPYSAKPPMYMWMTAAT